MTTTAHSQPAGELSNQTEPTRSGHYFRPLVDIAETADALLVYVDMPGVTADSIDVHFEDNTLAIHGQAASRAGEDAQFLLREYGIGDFYRTFRVSEGIDPEKISADYQNGVLTLELPKTEATKPRKIAVQTA